MDWPESCYNSMEVTDLYPKFTLWMDMWIPFGEFLRFLLESLLPYLSICVAISVSDTLSVNLRYVIG